MNRSSNTQEPQRGQGTHKKKQKEVGCIVVAVVVGLLVLLGAYSCFSKPPAVQWEWNINYGTFNDDIVVRNKNSFGITNVRVTVNFPSAGVNKTLYADVIGGYSEKRWVNAVKVPYGSKGTATLTCDQNKQK